MLKMNDKSKWDDLWEIQVEIGGTDDDTITTKASWDPTQSQLHKYRNEGIYPNNDIKERKHILEIIDYRNINDPISYDVKVIYMTATDECSGWGAVVERKLLKNTSINGYLVIYYSDEFRNLSNSRLYLITRAEIIDNFTTGDDGRLHFKPNDGIMGKFRLPDLDFKGNSAIKNELPNICNRLSKKPILKAPLSTADIHAYYINELIKNSF